MKNLNLIVAVVTLLVGGLWMSMFIGHPGIKAGLWVVVMWFLTVLNGILYNGIRKREME